MLTVEFILGIPCLGINGGPAFRHRGFRLNRDGESGGRTVTGTIIGNGGVEASAVGARTAGASPGKSPRVLTVRLRRWGKASVPSRAMMTMKKIDIAAIEAARRG